MKSLPCGDGCCRIGHPPWSNRCIWQPSLHRRHPYYIDRWKTPEGPNSPSGDISGLKWLLLQYTFHINPFGRYHNNSGLCNKPMRHAHGCAGDWQKAPSCRTEVFFCLYAALEIQTLLKDSNKERIPCCRYAQESCLNKNVSWLLILLETPTCCRKFPSSYIPKSRYNNSIAIT